jgi:hypothetical protein
MTLAGQDRATDFGQLRKPFPKTMKDRLSNY